MMKTNYQHNHMLCNCNSLFGQNTGIEWRAAVEEIVEKTVLCSEVKNTRLLIAPEWNLTESRIK